MTEAHRDNLPNWIACGFSWTNGDTCTSAIATLGRGRDDETVKDLRARGWGITAGTWTCPAHMPDPRQPWNLHCTNCGDTRGGAYGHEAYECTWIGSAVTNEEFHEEDEPVTDLVTAFNAAIERGKTRRPLRRAGAVWRLLVHRHPTDGSKSDMAYQVQSDRVRDRQDSEYSQTIVLERTELDEVVAGSWLHLEALDTGLWWLNIGGVVVHVNADRDGRPTTVTVHGPGDWNGPVDGCRYELDWSAE